MKNNLEEQDSTSPSLPNEMLIQIFGFFNNKGTLARAAQVSKQWNAVSKNPLFNQLPYPPLHFNCSFKGHHDWVYTLVIFNRKIISGSEDKTIKIWDSKTGECEMTLSGHTNGVRALAILDNQYIVSGSIDKTIKIWNSETGECKETIDGHTQPIRCLTTFNGRIVSGSEDSTIKLWNRDQETFECKKTSTAHQGYIMTLAVFNNNIVSGSSDKTIILWDPETDVRKIFFGHTYSVRTITIFNEKIVSGSDDGTIKIWNPKTGECEKTLNGNNAWVGALSVFDERIFSTSSNEKIKIWNLKNDQCEQTFECPHYISRNKYWINALIILPDKREIFTASRDNELKSLSFSMKKDREQDHDTLFEEDLYESSSEDDSSDESPPNKKMRSR